MKSYVGTSRRNEDGTPLFYREMDLGDTVARMANERRCESCGLVMEHDAIDGLYTLCLGCRANMKEKAASYGGTGEEIHARFNDLMRPFRTNKLMRDMDLGGHRLDRALAKLRGTK